MKLLPFDQDRFNAKIAAAIRQLQRTTAGNERPSIEEWAEFNWDTPTVPSSYAAITGYPVRIGGQITTVVMSAGTAASGSSTFKVRVDGTQVGNTLTFPASTTAPTALWLGASVRVAAGSLIHVEPVTIGTGLLGFFARVVMKG